MGVKILNVGDPHIRGNSPSTRKDNFPETLKNKFREIIALAETSHADAIVIDGDLFHRPDTQYSVITEFGRILKTSKVPIYVVVGNHDVYGYNIATLNRTALGILSGFGIVRVIKDHEPVFLEKDDIRLQLTGRSFHYKMDKQDPKYDYFVKKDPSADYAIHVVHGNMLPKTVFKGMAHTLIEQIVTEADVTVAGHFHPGFKMVEKDGQYFMNDGAISRVNASMSEATRTVQVTFIDFDKDGIKFTKVPLQSAPSAELAIDRTKLEERAEKEIKMQAFTAEIERAGAMKKYSSEEILEIISSNEDISDDIKSEALKRIGKAQEHVSTRNNFPVPKLSNVSILKLIIQNFQAHKYTEVAFDENGINILCGETNQGKTAVLRALKWVLLNEQRGKDFIRAGETAAQVTVCFPDNISITRLRTASKNQYILNKDGEVQIFEGFGNEVPKEIIDIHGITKIAIDEEGKVKLSLHMANQLDGPFLLSLGGSYKAKALGIITGVDVIDYAAESVMDEMSILSNEKKKCDEIIDRNKKELEKYADLDVFKVSLDSMENKLNQLKKMAGQIQLLENLKSRYENVNSSIEHVSGIANKLKNLAEIEVKLYKTEQMVRDVVLLERINSKYTQIEMQIEVCRDVIDKTECLGVLESKVSLTEEKMSKLNGLIKLKRQYEQLNEQSGLCENVLTKTENLKSTLSKVTTAETLAAKMQELLKLKDRVLFAESTENQINAVLDKTKNIDELNKKIVSAEKLASTIEELQKLSYKASRFKFEYHQVNAVITKLDNLSELEQRIQKIEELNSKVERFSVLLKDYEEVSKRTSDGEMYIKQLVKKMDIKVQKYRDELIKLGECPICESKIELNVVENIIKEYKKGSN